MNFMQKVLYVMMSLCVANNYASEYDSYNQFGTPSFMASGSGYSMQVEPNLYAQSNVSEIYPSVSNEQEYTHNRNNYILVIEQRMESDWQRINGHLIDTQNLSQENYKQCYDFLQLYKNHYATIALMLQENAGIDQFLKRKDDQGEYAQEKVNELAAKVILYQQIVEQKCPTVAQQQKEVAELAVQQKEDSVETQGTIFSWQAMDKHLQSMSQKLPSYVNKNGLILFLVLALAAKCGALEGGIALLQGGTSVIFSGLGLTIAPLGMAGQVFMWASPFLVITLAALSLKK